MITKGDWKAWRFSKYHNWKVSMGDRNEFLDLGMEEESEANAQLIASAPRLDKENEELKKINRDLHEALKDILNRFNIPMDYKLDGNWNKAIQALSAVEGKE